MAAPATPTKTCALSDICVLCGFSFIQYEKKDNGEVILRKHFDRKLRFTTERVENVYKITGINFSSNSAVCLKCYRSVDSVIKSEQKNENIKANICSMARKINETHLLQLPSPRRKVITKRMLRSPVVTQSAKKGKTFNIEAVKYIPVHIAPFKEITNTGDIDKPKTVRRSLEFQDVKVNLQANQGEIEITIAYPSGRRTELVRNETEQKICRAIFNGRSSGNAKNAIIAVVSTAYRKEVVTAVSHIISCESKELCKRNSGSILQQKDHNSILEFSWDKFYRELHIKAPNTLRVIQSAVSDVPVAIGEKKFINLMLTVASAFHGRNQEMPSVHYQLGFILAHGGCTQRDIDRLAKCGMTVTSKSMHSKLETWISNLDAEVIALKKSWEEGQENTTKYQLIGDNWDKKILPSYRTSQNQTQSIHLFNVLIAVDRVQIPVVTPERDLEYADISFEKFVPSLEEQEKLKEELVFITATSVIRNIPHLSKLLDKIYPKHLPHKYSDQAGIKTVQYPLGLYDCNETKTADVIKLLKELQQKYVPHRDGEICEPVLFGGDRLTDERIQCAQEAMLNGNTSDDRLEGFISKIEDFHRSMNFFRKMDLENLSDSIPLPQQFYQYTDADKISWINDICERIIEKYFFEGSPDIMSMLRDCVTDKNHPDNYWVSNFNEGRVNVIIVKKLMRMLAV
ncbi:uncharacterized protein LOC133196920 [Saccostrea echinata]|uniref:uncharacterized protein LOC133196920 n=1 Tax=Saccostrea echinata TaxID=191078 RepID=UPI002A80500A|nr:uncharacterized protein LOC133196920 [Saccostrea echinata]